MAEVIVESNDMYLSWNKKREERDDFLPASVNKE
jgi:hypothetical protein